MSSGSSWWQTPDDQYIVAAQVIVTPLDDVRVVRDGYRTGRCVEADLTGVADEELQVVVDFLHGLVTATGGEMWEPEDSVVLLAPPAWPGPQDNPPPTGTPPSSGPSRPDPAGDREPRTPSDPTLAGAVRLPVPDGD